MKRIIIFCIITTLFCSSCGTVFGGKVTNYQQEIVKPFQPSKQIRPVAFAFDVLFFPALIIDFSNCSIYKPITAARIAYR